MESFPDALHESLTTQFIFGPFCVVPGKRLLTRNGVAVEIGGRALDLLIALLEQPGRVLSKYDLIDKVWPDSVVAEGSLRFHMTGLRRILGDGEEQARYIATQVGVGYAFVAPLERKQAAVQPAPIATRTAEGVCSLPPRAKLIGRETDLQLVIDHMQQPRLFTIVGPGGVGKTSLAIEVAHRIAAQGYERVSFVDLAQVEDCALVPSALARSLDIPVQAEDPLFVLLAHLREQRLMLVIDNCEHLIDAVSTLLEQISDTAPDVGVLATSREPLRVRGEYVHWLNPLEFPREPQHLSVAELLAFPAIKLFVERASSSNAALLLEAGGGQMIADICQRLEGMALPIELAAMRVASHGLKATHALLGERFSLGWSGRRTAVPRHQTLRAMLDWSYDLLSPQERLALERFSVFVGPFSQEAAAQVVAESQHESAAAAAILDDLVCKGLVTVDHSDSTDSYRLLEMTRAYAREKLAARGEAEVNALAFRHAAFYMDLLGHLGTAPDEIFRHSARLASQLGNVRGALEWSFGPHGDPGLALPLAAASAPLFLHFSLLVECRTWCSRAVELLELGYYGTPTEMELQAALGLVLMFTRGNSEAAEKALLRAQDIAVALNDYGSQLRLLGRLQIFYERIGDFPSSLAWAEQAAAVGNILNEPAAIAIAASLTGISHHLLGNQRLARQELESSLRNSLPSHPSNTIYYGFDHRNRTGLALARSLWLQGYPDQARRLAEQIEAEASALQHPVTYCIAMVWILCIYIWTGDLAKATASLERFSAVAETNALGPYIAACHGLRAAIAIRAEEPGEAVAMLEESLARLRGMRYELLTTSFEIALAEGLMLVGQHSKAMTLVNGTIDYCRRSGDAFALPELLRIKAGILKVIQADDVQAMLAVLEDSIALSREQGAWAWELRSSMDLARFWLEQGQPDQARALLGACRERASEGFDSLDLRRLESFWQSLPATPA
ncbi:MULTISPECIES: winged helix-turn-helix domain-containing protein [unclassified Pseudomonas]|uniref:ATP-binding protein n=1 Tax=unclassified Pseudomonas TaxID=196821 RepID=UPI000A1EDA4A|nr:MULTISPECIES: winged helix-turn-helix domain-containing protein [unclassified Pseudomonas]